MINPLPRSPNVLTTYIYTFEKVLCSYLCRFKSLCSNAACRAIHSAQLDKGKTMKETHTDLEIIKHRMRPVRVF